MEHHVMSISTKVYKVINGKNSTDQYAKQITDQDWQMETFVCDTQIPISHWLDQWGLKRRGIYYVFTVCISGLSCM